LESVDHRFSEIPILQKPIEREMLKRLFFSSVQRGRSEAAPEKSDYPVADQRDTQSLRPPKRA
jgi:hypothetical protein